MEEKHMMEEQDNMDDQPMQPIYVQNLLSLLNKFLSEGSAKFQNDTRSREEIFECEILAGLKAAQSNFPECRILWGYYVELALWSAFCKYYLDVRLHHG